MHSLATFLRIFFILSVLTMPLQAQQSKEIRSYVFGNSLINHLSESVETTVPYWLYHLAKSVALKNSVLLYCLISYPSNSLTIITCVFIFLPI